MFRRRTPAEKQRKHRKENRGKFAKQLEKHGHGTKHMIVIPSAEASLPTASQVKKLRPARANRPTP